LIALEKENRIPHAIMLTGPSGCGKMAIAIAFASHLLGNSRLLDHWNHPDLHFTYPTIKLPSMGSEHQPVSDDFANEWKNMLQNGPYFSLEHWTKEMGATTQQAIITGAESDELTRKLSMKASMGGYKISIIWMPERMNQTCANKMLKLLEEPPGQTLFIMVSEEPEKLIETIRSRTQRIDVKRIGEDTLTNALIQRRAIEEQTARQTARLAAGSWTKALEILNAGNEYKLFFDMFVLLMRLAYGRRLKELKKWSESVAGYGREKQKRLLAYIGRMVRENFMYNFGLHNLNYMTDDEENFARKFSPFINEDNVIGISQLIEKAVRDISQNANGKIVFFDFALQIIILLNKKN
ncbi:MAG: ATP-binding protein, partial [Prevotella sp.]